MRFCTWGQPGAKQSRMTDDGDIVSFIHSSGDFRMNSNVLIVALVFLVMSGSIVTAQVESGMWGMGAAMALPSGVAASVVSSSGNAGGSAIGQAASFTYTGGSEVCYQINRNLQLDGGIGIGLVSFGVSTGTAADSRTTISIAAGGRYYTRTPSDVSPYLGAGLSYTIIPTITSGNSEVSGGVFMINACFGVEAMLAKHVAVFSQLGVGYNSGSISSKSTVGGSSTTVSGSVNTLSLGGSAIGLHIYWN